MKQTNQSKHQYSTIRGKQCGLQWISLKSGVLAQAADSHSGETATEGLGGSSNARLGETNSFEQDHPLPKGEVPCLG